MNPQLRLFGAFALGVLVTVGVYEVVRVVQNAREAIAAASTTMAAEEGPPIPRAVSTEPARKPRKKTAGKPRKAPLKEAPVPLTERQQQLKRVERRRRRERGVGKLGAGNPTLGVPAIPVSKRQKRAARQRDLERVVDTGADE